MLKPKDHSLAQVKWKDFRCCEVTYTKGYCGMSTPEVSRGAWGFHREMWVEGLD